MNISWLSQSARAARSALGSQGRKKIDPKTLEIRKALAEKLKQEVINEDNWGLIGDYCWVSSVSKDKVSNIWLKTSLYWCNQFFCDFGITIIAVMILQDSQPKTCCSPSYRLSLEETTGPFAILSLRKLNNLNRLSWSPKIDAQTRHCFFEWIFS